ncbi:MAG: hypothetical protein MI922_11610 [Bacteroidales bacterium]|nr:hypothetical protein [Bacteroidales bacterium]
MKLNIWHIAFLFLLQFLITTVPGISDQMLLGNKVVKIHCEPLFNGEVLDSDDIVLINEIFTADSILNVDTLFIGEYVLDTSGGWYTNEQINLDVNFFIDSSYSFKFIRRFDGCYSEHIDYTYDPVHSNSDTLVITSMNIHYNQLSYAEDSFCQIGYLEPITNLKTSDYEVNILYSEGMEIDKETGIISLMQSKSGWHELSFSSDYCIMDTSAVLYIDSTYAVSFPDSFTVCKGNNYDTLNHLIFVQEGQSSSYVKIDSIEKTGNYYVENEQGCSHKKITWITVNTPKFPLQLSDTLLFCSPQSFEQHIPVDSFNITYSELGEEQWKYLSVGPTGSGFYVLRNENSCISYDTVYIDLKHYDTVLIQIKDTIFYCKGELFKYKLPASVLEYQVHSLADSAVFETTDNVRKEGFYYMQSKDGCSTSNQFYIKIDMRESVYVQDSIKYCKKDIYIDRLPEEALHYKLVLNSDSTYFLEVEEEVSLEGRFHMRSKNGCLTSNEFTISIDTSDYFDINDSITYCSGERYSEKLPLQAINYSIVSLWDSLVFNTGEKVSLEGEFYLKSDGECNVSNTFVIIILPNNSPQISSKAIWYCDGQNFEEKLPSGLENFEIVVVDSGNYSLPLEGLKAFGGRFYLRNSEECSASDTFQVRISFSEFPYSVPSVISYCANQKFVDKLPYDSFISIKKIEEQDWSTLDAVVNSSGTYELKYDSIGACIAYDTIKVILHEPKPLVISKTEGCDKVTLQLLGANLADSLPSWSNGTLGAVTEVDNSEVLFVSYQDINNCPIYDSIIVDFEPFKIVTASIEKKDADCWNKGEVSINSIMTNDGDYTNGDNYKLIDTVTKLTIDDLEEVREGIYQLQVKDDRNCIATYDELIVIEQNCHKKNPVFSPENAEYFIPNDEGEVKIYNMEGELLKTIPNTPAYWDGNSDKNNALPMGNYIMVTGTNKVINITIIR